MKTYVIGDLHGRHDLLSLAIEKIQSLSPEGGRFICLGDFVDRGPDSRQIIETFMAGPPEDWEWIVLQGNHEYMMLQACLFPMGVYANVWGSNGAYNTLVSYGYPHVDFEHCVPVEHQQWLAQLPIYFEDEHRIYVHAGVPMNQQVQDTKRETLQWMMYRDGSSNYSDAEYHPDGTHISGKQIIHGHVQSEKHPLVKTGRINLDAWAYKTGRLVIGVFDGDTPMETLWVQGE